jgi:hypothetical protein
LLAVILIINLFITKTRKSKNPGVWHILYSLEFSYQAAFKQAGAGKSRSKEAASPMPGGETPPLHKRPVTITVFPATWYQIAMDN